MRCDRCSDQAGNHERDDPRRAGRAEPQGPPPHHPSGLPGCGPGRCLRLRGAEVRQVRVGMGGPPGAHLAGAGPAGRGDPVQPRRLLAGAGRVASGPDPGSGRCQQPDTNSIANTVPGGGVVAIGVSYVMLRSWGFTTAEVTLSTLVTGIWNSFGKLAMPIFAVAVLTLTGGTRVALFLPALAGVAVLVAAVVVFGLLMWKKAFAHRIGAALGCCASW